MNDSLREALTERVFVSAALLDALVPDWYMAIDLDTLDVGDTSTCPLAQIAAYKGWDSVIENGYDAALDKLGIDGVEYGFDCSVELMNIGGYRALTSAWITEVLSRRS